MAAVNVQATTEAGRFNAISSVQEYCSVFFMLNMICCNEYSTGLICLSMASSIAVLLHRDLCVIFYLFIYFFSFTSLSPTQDLEFAPKSSSFNVLIP